MSSLIENINTALIEGEYQPAISAVTKAIAAEPKNAALHHTRGVIHVLRSREWPVWRSGGEKQRKATLERGLVDLNKAISLAPDYAEAHLNRALTHLLLIDTAAAVADFTRALELGLEPAFAIQAYSYRSNAQQDSEARLADIRVVNTLRRSRTLGAEWSHGVPQAVSMRVTVPERVGAATKANLEQRATRASRPPKPAKAMEPAAVVAAFEALVDQTLKVKKVAGLRALHRKMDKLDLLEAGDAPGHRRAIDKAIKRLRAYRKSLPEVVGRELDNILDTVTDS